MKTSTRPLENVAEALNSLNARCKREKNHLESLRSRYETTLKERAVLLHIVHREEEARCGKGRCKSMICWQELRSFMEYASRLFDRLQRRLRISLRYAWFCQWLCTQYGFCRQRGGALGTLLSPYTVLSYFKRERAGE